MKPRKFEIIKCPKCGYEYLPCELFVPKYFFGKPTKINRDFEGQIFDYEGPSVDLNETYTCDKCNTTFKIVTRMLFITEPDKLDNFDEEYVSPLQKNVLFLEEE